MTISLEYCVEFGKNDYSEWIDYEVEVDEKTYELYKMHLDNADDLNKCKDLQFILFSVYDDIAEIEKNNFDELGYEIEEEEIENWEINIRFIDPNN